MKKIFIIMLSLIFCSAVFSQQTKSDYLKKSKHQKTFAWVLLGGGVLSTSLGLAGSGINPDYGEKGGTGFLITGLVAIGASIPFFIASSKNKKKAMSMSFKNQMIPQLQVSNFAYRAIPSINIKIDL